MAAVSAFLLLLSIACMYLCLHKIALLLMASPYLHPVMLFHKRHEITRRIQFRLDESAVFKRTMNTMRERRRAEQVEKAMPEAIRLLCISFESGSSLVQALRYASNNCAEPLASELKQAVCDLEAGQGFDETMEDLRFRTGSPEFALLAVSMEMQHQSGGSLSAILETVGGLLKQSSDLNEELRTKTTQSRLSCRIVAIMPIILVALLSLLSPGYLHSFFSSPLGMCMLVLALSLELVGIVLVRKSLEIDYCIDLEEAS